MKANRVETLLGPRWRTLIALPTLTLSALAGIYSLWGLLFIYWGANAIRDGETYLVEDISRYENPVLFWSIIILWIGFGALYVGLDILPL